MKANEKRVSSRHRLDRRGWIAQGSAMVTVDLVDISAQGAKIAVPAKTVLPDRFDLLLTVDGKVGRVAKVAWRADEMVGLKFVGRYRPRQVSPDTDDSTAAQQHDAAAAAANLT